MSMTLEHWLHDFRVAARGFRRAGSLYFGLVGTLTLGVVGATVMFALIRGILLRPLPIPHEDRLIVSWRTPPVDSSTHMPYRASDIDELTRGSQLFEIVTGVGYNGAFENVWVRRGTVLTARTAVVMGRFFDATGVVPVMGRGLVAGDDQEGAAKSVVLSYGVWQRWFGGARDAIGQSLEGRGHAFTIVGVMPADFEYPRGVEIWTTRSALATTEPNAGFRTGLLRDVELLGRLRPGVTYEQATSELSSFLTRLDAEMPQAQGTRGFRPQVRAYKDVVVGDFSTALVVLFAAVGLVLAIACANAANLMLMRVENRRSEFSLRAALGAPRSRVIAQLLIESGVVAVPVGILGLLMSQWGLGAVATLVPDGLPRASSVRIDTMVILFTLGLAILASAVSAVVPASRAWRLCDVGGLRSAGRGPAGSPRHRGRRMLVMTQVALAMTVVAGAGLLIQSFERLQAADMGLAHHQIVFAELDLPRDRYADQQRRRQFLDDVAGRIAAVTGANSVTPINALPFAGASGWEVPRFTIEGQTLEQTAENPALNLEAVHATYFAALDVPILRGRPFTRADRSEAPRVAIVSRDVSARAWPNQDPIGKRLKMGGPASQNDWLTVVGVAATTRYRELATPRPTLYLPADQFMITASRFAIHTTSAPSVIAGLVRDAVRSSDSAVQVLRVAPYADYLQQPLARPRFNALLLEIFGISGLLLSCVGLYSVMAASVRQRQTEIGVRVALGATANDVRRLVLGEGLRLTAAGVLAGLAAALGLTRAVRGMLFEVQPLDPPTLLMAASVLTVACLLACYPSTRRATRIDPAAMLRAE